MKTMLFAVAVAGSVTIPTFPLAGGGSIPALAMGGNDFAGWFAAATPKPRVPTKSHQETHTISDEEGHTRVIPSSERRILQIRRDFHRFQQKSSIYQGW